MKSKIAIAIAAVLLCVMAANSQDKPAPDELVATEHAFAQAAAESGVNAGFRRYLAPDGIIFRPGPVNGQAHLKDKPESSSQLGWSPEHAVITSTGDFGWTTGPWNWRADSTQPAGLFGQYLSVWQRQADGSLKLVLDLGVVYPDERTVADVGFVTLPAHSVEPLSDEQLQSERTGLMELDRRWTGDSKAAGVSAAMLAVAAPDMLLLRTGKPPMVGSAAVGEFLSVATGIETRRPAFAAVSLHGEFGYTYGEGDFLPTDAEPDESQPFAYASLWQRGETGEWRLAADVTTPLPAEKSSEEKH